MLSKNATSRRAKSAILLGPILTDLSRSGPLDLKLYSSLLDDAVIEHEIYTEMKLFMHASGLKKTPGHKAKETDIHLWKQYSK